MLNKAFKLAKGVLFDDSLLWLTGSLLLVGETVLNAGIIYKVPYTEIDWIAYMQEVAGVIEEGDWDYTHLEGQTGPCVYPAGFIYLFSLLYWATDKGANILRAQYMFAALYIATQAVVFGLYAKSKKMRPYVLICLCVSYRVHSLFALRLFNDCFAMFFLYIALYLFVSDKWGWGCLWFSIAVSIKMNVLLYAPALLLLLIKRFGYVDTIKYLAICASVQLAFAAPFLAVNPLGYMSRAFNLGRVFMYKWTVNFRFLSEEVFVSPTLSLSLLAIHALVALPLFLTFVWCVRDGGLKAALTRTPGPLPTDHILTLMFTSNLIGIVFARSLHYQFYSWYYHTLPYLAWRTRTPVVFKLAILGGIEFAFNTYPSTELSSAVLWVCHLCLLGALFLAPCGEEAGKSGGGGVGAGGEGKKEK